MLLAKSDKSPEHARFGRVWIVELCRKIRMNPKGSQLLCVFAFDVSGFGDWDLFGMCIFAVC